MAAFFAGVLSLIVGLLLGFIIGIAFVGFMIGASEHLRNLMRSVCDDADREFGDDDF